MWGCINRYLILVGFTRHTKEDLLKRFKEELILALGRAHAHAGNAVSD